MSSLVGLRILNTRPLSSQDHLSTQIRQAGGVSIALPAITIAPASTPWQATWCAQARVDQMIFVSPHAVDYFLQGLDPDTIQHLRHSNTAIFAVGPATQARLTQHHLHVHAIPTIADSEHLLALDALQHVENKTIALIKGHQGRDLIEKTLLQRGARLMSIIVYDSVLPTYPKEKLRQLWQGDEVDLILYTSQQSIVNIFTLLTTSAHAWLCEKPSLVISERIAAFAMAQGIKTIIHSRHDDILSTLKGSAHELRQRT